MAPSIQVFVQVALLFCVLTTSMGVIIDWPKEFSQLENKVTEQQEEIKSLYLIIQQLEKRLQILEMKGGIGGFMPVCWDYPPVYCAIQQNFLPALFPFKLNVM